MGVLELFGTLARQDITASSIKSDYQERAKINHLLLDFNSIIHVAGMKIITDINTFFQSVLRDLSQGRSINNLTMADGFETWKMQKVKKKMNENTGAEEMIELFHQHFTDEYLDKQIIALVINTVLSIIRTYCHNKNLKTLMIAIDGVPSKGKLIEQKQRRYMGAIIESYKERLFRKYKDYLKEQPGNVYLSSAHAIKWNRNKITPGSEFMDRMVRYLNSQNITDKFKVNRNQMEIVISSMYEVGEGEKKIVNYIYQNLENTEDSVMVYSPDADMILLCMLLPVKNLSFLRHHAQNSVRFGRQIYDLIDIPVLKKNIAYYINNHQNYSQEKFDINKINRDIVCLSTLFGNDFVPKIETINVKQGFQDIMDAYLDALIKTKSKKYYLVKKVDGQFKLNYTFLKLVIENLIPYEDDFIKYNDFYNRFRDAGRLRSIFDYLTINSKNIHEIVNQFRQEYEMLKGIIRNGGSYIAFESNDQFMSSLKKCIDIRVENQQVNATYLTNQQLIELIKKQYTTNQNFPRLDLSLNEFSHSINDVKYRRILKGKKLNDYDKEKYQFENMLDEYYVKLNAQPLQLSSNKLNDFYQTYFGVNVQNKNLTPDFAAIMEHYIEGMMWVFSYYFNDRTYLNTWYYRYERAPLLRHILLYLNSVDRTHLTNLYDGLSKYIVTDPSTFFNPVEQFMYVSPMTKEIIKLLPENYRKYIQSGTISPIMQNIFINVQDISKRLWKDPVSMDVDCRSIPFFNKCFVKVLEKPTAGDDREFIKAMRKVKPTADYIQRSKSNLPSY